MWQTFVVKQYHFVNGKRHRLITITYEETWGWRGAICKLFTKIGNFVSAGRRKSWPLDRIWSRHYWGLYAYSKIKDLLLYGKVFKAETRWCNGEEFVI